MQQLDISIHKLIRIIYFFLKQLFVPKQIALQIIVSFKFISFYFFSFIE